VNELWGILALFALGVALQRLRAFRSLPTSPRVLSQFVIHVSLPAVILRRIPGLDLTPEALLPALIPWAMLAFSAGAVLLVARRMRWDGPTTGALMMVVPLGNTSFLGLPMVRAYLGEEAIPYAILYDQLGTFLALSTYGAFVLGKWGRPPDDADAAQDSVLRKVLTFPPFVTLVVAFALRGVAFPEWVTSALDVAAASLVPVIMVAVGLQFRLVVERADAGPIAFGLVTKMAAAPLLAWGLCALVGAAGEPSRTSVFEAAMPPMMTAGLLASDAGLRRGVAIGAVGIGLLASFATLPLVAWLLR
jgi:malate permease and related proteins